MLCDRSDREVQQSQRAKRQAKGAIAQLGEHLLCKQGVGGSIPPGSTISPLARRISKKKLMDEHKYSVFIHEF